MFGNLFGSGSSGLMPRSLWLHKACVNDMAGLEVAKVHHLCTGAVHQTFREWLLELYTIVDRFRWNSDDCHSLSVAPAPIRDYFPSHEDETK